jgi:hypothetical protein
MVEVLYLPLTPTPRKQLTYDFATPRLSPPTVCAPRPSSKRSGSLRDRLDERDIAELITAYREGATATSLAAAHGLSLTSIKYLLHIAGVHRTSPRNELPRQRQPLHIRSPLMPGVHRAHRGRGRCTVWLVVSDYASWRPCPQCVVVASPPGCLWPIVMYR